MRNRWLNIVRGSLDDMPIFNVYHPPPLLVRQTPHKRNWAPKACRVHLSLLITLSAQR